MSRVSPSSPFVRSLILGGVILVALSAPSFAQGRGGSRGGGGGGRGGGGGAGMSSETPMQRIREQLKETDELEFLDKRSKQLSLDKEQKEAIKSLNKEMDALQKPIFKEMEKSFADAEREASMNGGSDRGGIVISNDPGAGGGGRGGRGGMPPAIRESMLKLTNIQTSFAERSAALLKGDQKHLADSLRLIYKDELREKAARKARSRSGGMGGRGR